MPSNSSKKRIGIIGAGPAGLAALKTALETHEYRTGEWADPVVLEAREDVGGVWLPSPASFPKPCHPSTSSSRDEECSPHTSASDAPGQKASRYPATPLYDSLTTNLPHPVMAFSSFPFPPSTPLFPKAAVVHEYLSAYADQLVTMNSNGTPKRLREYVKTRRRATSVRWAPNHPPTDANTIQNEGVWAVEAAVTPGPGNAAATGRYAFDLLLVCTGHYSTPNYPSEGDMPGLGAWRDAGRAAHAVWYRNAEGIPLPPEEDDEEGTRQQEIQNQKVLGNPAPSPNAETARSDDVRASPSQSLSESKPKSTSSRLKEDSDTHFEEVYEKAVADAQTSSHNMIPKSSNINATSSSTGKSRLTRATVLIVGAGPSGTDIAADLVRAGVRKVIVASSATPSATPPPPPSPSSSSTTTTTSPLSSSSQAHHIHAPTVIAKPLPVRFHVSERGRPTGTVTFADGTMEDGVSFVVLATGYQVDFPFFDQSDQSKSRPGQDRAEEDRAEVDGRFRLPKGVLPTPFWTQESNSLSNGPQSTDTDTTGPDTDTGTRGSKSLTNSNICVFPLARHLFPLPGFYSRQDGESPHEHEPRSEAEAGSEVEVRGRGRTHSPHPTSLAFLGLNVRVAPMPLVEAQARASLSAFAYCSPSSASVSPSSKTPDGTTRATVTNSETKRDLDWAAEERAIRERWDALAAKYNSTHLQFKGPSQGTFSAGDRVSESTGLRKFIAKIWHRLPEDEQFAYRDDLDAFAFGLNPRLYTQLPKQNSNNDSGEGEAEDESAGPHKTREWEPRVYAQKGVLRSAWRALEARGDGSAEAWVRDVGSGRTGRRKKKKGGEGEGEGDGDGEVMNGEEEWVDMMERLVVWWEKEGKKEDEERIKASLGW